MKVGPSQTGLVRFDLSALPGFPSGPLSPGTIQKATLTFFVKSVKTGGSFTIRQVNFAWDENTKISPSSLLTTGLVAAPAPNPDSANFLIGSSDVNNFVTVDITNLMVDWANNSVANNGLALLPSSIAPSTQFEIFSKESSSQPAPFINVVLFSTGGSGGSGPTGATGATGAIGATGATGATG